MFGFGNRRQRAMLDLKLQTLYTDWCLWYKTTPSTENYSQFIADLTFDAK